MRIIESFVRKILKEYEFDQVRVDRLVGKKIQVQNASDIRAGSKGNIFTIKKLDTDRRAKSKMGNTPGVAAIMIFTSNTNYILASPKELEKLAKTGKSVFAEYTASGGDLWVTLI